MRVVTIEDIVYVEGQGASLLLTTGRMLLDDQGLYFVAGPVKSPMGNRNQGYHTGGLVGAAVGAAMDAAANRGQKDVNHEISEQLRSVSGLPAIEQVEKISGSFHISNSDIDRIQLGFLGPLSLTTSARGERYFFRVPRGGRSAVKNWISLHRR